MQLFVSLVKRFGITFVLAVALSVLSVIYTTHLNVALIPKGYDLLFHLGNVFALQVGLGFAHKSFASLAVSPLIFHDYGYGTHLFYPPLAHVVPAMIAYVLSKIGINSTLLSVRLFSFLTIWASGASMFFAMKKMTRHTVAATFAALVYLSAPYLQWDYYWRGGMSSSLCFVFLPLLLLSIYYFTKEKYGPYFFTFVISLTLLMYTHMITAFFSFLFFLIAVGVNFFFLKKKKAAFLSTLVGGVMIAVMTSPFWSLLLQQQLLHTHIIYSPSFPFTISTVAKNTLPFRSLFDLQMFVWQWKVRELFAVFNVISLGFFVGCVLLLRSTTKVFHASRFVYTLLALLFLIFLLVTTSTLWQYLPNFFAFIQYPPRLLLIATPIISLLSALPFVLIQKRSLSMLLGLGTLVMFIVVFTFHFNNYQLYDIGKTDYTTFSILQAMGVDQEYLPVNAKTSFEALEQRPRVILPLSNNTMATPSAQILTNETPYLLAAIGNNQSKETLFELPRLFYAGYELRWREEESKSVVSLPYAQSDRGLITTKISGNGTLEVQYTGGKWYWVVCLSAGVAISYLIWLLYKFVFVKKTRWLE